MLLIVKCSRVDCEEYDVVSWCKYDIMLVTANQIPTGLWTVFPCWQRWCIGF